MKEAKGVEEAGVEEELTKKQLYLRQSEYSNRFKDVRKKGMERAVATQHTAQDHDPDPDGDELSALRAALQEVKARTCSLSYEFKRPSWWG